MKKYTFEVVIHEGNDEFWESHIKGSGCDEVTEWVIDLLESDGLSLMEGQNCTVKLVEFTDQ